MLFDGTPPYPSVTGVNFLILKCHLAAKKLQFTGPPPKKKIRPHDHIEFSQPNQPNWPWDVIKPKVDFFSPFRHLGPETTCKHASKCVFFCDSNAFGTTLTWKDCRFQNTMGEKVVLWPRDRVIRKYYATCSHVLSKLGDTSTFTLLHYSKSTCYMLEEFLTNSLHLKFHPQSRKPDPCWLK